MPVEVSVKNLSSLINMIDLLLIDNRDWHVGRSSALKLMLTFPMCSPHLSARIPDLLVVIKTSVEVWSINNYCGKDATGGDGCDNCAIAPWT